MNLYRRFAVRFMEVKVSTERFQTAWNIVQRRIWNLPNLAHCSIVKWLSVNATVLAQLYSRCYNYNNSLLTSDNVKLRFIARNSFNSQRGIIGKNQIFCERKLMESKTKGKVLAANFDGLPNLQDWNISRMVHELNFVLDGFYQNGLSYEEILLMLCDISTN